jgi:hypothetical protein
MTKELFSRILTNKDSIRNLIQKQRIVKDIERLEGFLFKFVGFRENSMNFLAEKN